MMNASRSSVVYKVRALLLGLAGRVQWLSPLLGRLAVGLLFLSTGWGKVHDIPKVTAFFTTLGIPAPAFHAVLVGYSELIGGALLIVGLLTRLATIPLIVSMIVAILTAKLSELHNVFDLVGFEEFTYLVLLVMIAIVGPGPVSLDHFVVRSLHNPNQSQN
jgi:putative oxidoreductase